MYAVDTNRVMIKVRCPEHRLTDVAEVLRLEMKTVDGERDFAIGSMCTILPEQYPDALLVSKFV